MSNKDLTKIKHQARGLTQLAWSVALVPCIIVSQRQSRNTKNAKMEGYWVLPWYQAHQRVQVYGVLVGTGTGRVSEVVLRRVSARSSRSKFCRSVRELARDVVAARVLREVTFGEQSHYRHQDETGRGRGTGIEGWRGDDGSMSICVYTSLRTLQYSKYTL